MKRQIFTKEKLAREKFLRVLEKTAGAWKDKNHPELLTKKDLGKYIRRLRASFRKSDPRNY